MTAISGSEYTIQDTRDQTVTVTLTETTKVRLMLTQADGSLSDIQVGTNVQIMMDRPGSDGQTSVRESVREVVVEPDGDKVNGRVSAVDGDTITIKMRDDTLSIVTNSSTTFYKGTESASLSDVVTDTQVTAYGTLTDSTLTAGVVIIGGGHGPGGPGPEGGAGQQQGAPPTDQQGNPSDNQAQPAPDGST